MEGATTRLLSLPVLTDSPSTRHVSCQFPLYSLFSIHFLNNLCKMVESGRGDASIQAFFSPTPTPSPTKTLSASLTSSDTLVGDGFTEEEVKEALKPKPLEPWHPTAAYVECDIRDLLPGQLAVSFMGRVANIFDVMTTPKTPRSAKGCLKLCIKDNGGAITVSESRSLCLFGYTKIAQARLWYATHLPNVKLGALVSIWTTHSRKLQCSVLSCS